MSSKADFDLITAALEALALGAATSPIIHRVHGACEKLVKMVSLVLSTGEEPRTTSTSENSTFETTAEPIEMIDGWFPMSQEDWDSVMDDFGADTGEWNIGPFGPDTTPAF